MNPTCFQLPSMLGPMKHNWLPRWTKWSPWQQMLSRRAVSTMNAKRRCSRVDHISPDCPRPMVGATFCWSFEPNNSDLNLDRCPHWSSNYQSYFGNIFWYVRWMMIFILCWHARGGTPDCSIISLTRIPFITMDIRRTWNPSFDGTQIKLPSCL